MATAFDHRLLRAWRLDSGKTLEEVAFRAAVSYPYLRRLEDQGGNPSGALLARIAAVYGHDVSELFTTDPDEFAALDTKLARRRAS
ncbi:MAG: helix-turn-helix domain-containing protein [Streptosporangiaceae bacterium]